MPEVNAQPIPLSTPVRNILPLTIGEFTYSWYNGYNINLNVMGGVSPAFNKVIVFTAAELYKLFAQLKTISDRIIVEPIVIGIDLRAGRSVSVEFAIVDGDCFVSIAFDALAPLVMSKADFDLFCDWLPEAWESRVEYVPQQAYWTMTNTMYNTSTITNSIYTSPLYSFGGYRMY
jgi:hypothetical protein